MQKCFSCFWKYLREAFWYVLVFKCRITYRLKNTNRLKDRLRHRMIWSFARMQPTTTRSSVRWHPVCHSHPRVPLPSPSALQSDFVALCHSSHVSAKAVVCPVKLWSAFFHITSSSLASVCLESWFNNAVSALLLILTCLTLPVH